MVLDRSGAFQRSFTVKLIGTWQQENGQLKGKLDEWFVYDDGEKDTRTWLITKTADGEYTGTANDVIGQANGEARGNALYWRYDLEIQYKGKASFSLIAKENDCVVAEIIIPMHLEDEKV